MAVFNALVLMVLKGLEKLHSMLTKKPLFKASNQPCCSAIVLLFVLLAYQPVLCLMLPNIIQPIGHWAAAQLPSSRAHNSDSQSVLCAAAQDLSAEW
jgi:hypothetical protein